MPPGQSPGVSVWDDDRQVRWGHHEQGGDCSTFITRPRKAEAVLKFPPTPPALAPKACVEDGGCFPSQYCHRCAFVNNSAL